MKIRHGFVSNSSSTCFIIKNTSNSVKTLVDFVEENPQLVQEFNEEYDYHYTQEEMLACAAKRMNKGDSKDIWQPKESSAVAFGDEDGDTLGHVFDYILRDGGESPSFRWRFKEYWR